MPTEVPDQGSGVAGDVPGDRLDVTALAVGAAADVQPGVAEPGVDVDRGAQLVAQQGQGGVPEGERRVQGHRGGHGVQGALLQPEQVADAAVVRRYRVDAPGQRQSVAVDTSHVSTLKNWG